MANQVKREKDWSPLCNTCLSRLKSADFRNAILDRDKALTYDFRTDDLVIQCVLCSLIARQLNFRTPGSASKSGVAGVFSLGRLDPSLLYLEVNNNGKLNLNLFTRSGKNTVTPSYS